MSRNTHIPRSVKHALAPTPGQLQRWKSHQKQTRVKGAWRIAQAEADSLLFYDPTEHGPSFDKYRWEIQNYYQEKRKLLQAGVDVDV